MGTNALLKKTGAEYLDNRTIRESAAIHLENKEIRVIHTPGHTRDSVTFYTGDALITGDTLFVGTVGNCFSGDMKGYFESLKRLLAFPPGTFIYPGHDYVEYAMSAAKEIDGSNSHIDNFWEAYDPGLIRSTIALELKINPFVRFNDDSLTPLLMEKNLPVRTEFERWTSLMTMH
jgi:hydroxyacylglutathione hydrolase